jgi:hypothetical protein
MAEACFAQMASAACASPPKSANLALKTFSICEVLFVTVAVAFVLFSSASLYET